MEAATDINDAEQEESHAAFLLQLLHKSKSDHSKISTKVQLQPFALTGVERISPHYCRMSSRFEKDGDSKHFPINLHSSVYCCQEYLLLLEFT